MTRLVVPLAVTIACSAEDGVLPNAEPDELGSSRSEALVPQQSVGLMPRWRVGDAWVVRQQTEYTTRNRELRRVEFDWEYRVEWITGGFVAITATHVNTIPRGTHRLEGTTRLLFRMNAELVEVELPREHDPEITVEPRVHFPMGAWEERDSGRYGWPQFPLVEGSRIELAEGFDQTVARAGGDLHVTVSRHYNGTFSHGDLSGDIVQTLEQTWEPNRPWWSSIRVRARIVGESGHRSDMTYYEASVIEWRPAKQ